MKNKKQFLAILFAFLAGNIFCEEIPLADFEIDIFTRIIINYNTESSNLVLYNDVTIGTTASFLTEEHRKMISGYINKHFYFLVIK